MMKFQCEFCDRNYSYQKNLNLHLRKAHGLETGIASFPFDAHKHKCLEGCHTSFRLISDLRLHLKQDHGKIMDPEFLAFRSMRDFKIWFENLTKQNNVTYYRGSTAKKCVYFFCNRSGVSRVKDIEKRKRALKKQGSCKIQHSCTNQIILMEKDGQILVTYYKEHYGHKEEVQHLRLPKKDVLLIASKMASGESPTRIISEARKKRDSNNLKRVDLINRKDLHNIRRSLGLNVVADRPSFQRFSAEESDIQITGPEDIYSKTHIETEVVDVKEKLFEILDEIKKECCSVDDGRILTKFYEKLKQTHDEFVAIKTRKFEPVGQEIQHSDS